MWFYLYLKVIDLSLELCSYFTFIITFSLNPHCKFDTNVVTIIQQLISSKTIIGTKLSFKPTATARTRRLVIFRSLKPFIKWHYHH